MNIVHTQKLQIKTYIIPKHVLYDYHNSSKIRVKYIKSLILKIIKEAIIISFHLKIILIDPFLHQIPTYIFHIDVSKMMINYTLKQIMFQLHNLADKINGKKMLFIYIKLNKMMAVAKTRYKFKIDI